MRLSLAPRRLAGPAAALEPLADVHREGLRNAAEQDADVWSLYLYSMRGAHFDPYWARKAEETAQGRTLLYAVVAAGAVVGVTSFLEIDRTGATVEVGGTYLAPAVRGGRVNPQIKRLMLEEAFTGGARRVGLRVDALNAHSLAAVAKLGAVREGVLRRNQVTWTGRVRDTVLFSILAEEWPAVRAGLDRRLAPAADAGHQ